ncbi:lipid-A-disaccharide synthase [Advenella mimigardefordensis]|uniref:Lipid-A-disaccharide synthase n=1 Tax=Advenella mimigardefordensis (strain DSM 17166 / LMG 22922 / DPN7) TaxID=1247726 RepID=W0PBB2_ADVMD|nr:lipid-A-disaccharide synthase [Advenella mimigardefordensis]AHG64026.1 lipid-A-disaccharide synthase [Advenella mimigardefordensis DPN7]
MSLVLSMVAGEPSGDLLASRIIQGIRARDSGLQASGIGGPEMQQQGMQLHYPMDDLSVFGYVDALKNLPRLIHTYLRFRSSVLKLRPDVFVGVDAPDFNLRLEHHIRQRGIPTVHFVGPSIWAWRYERIHKIREAVSHMLVLFPFEEEIYRKEGVPVTYVGHPLAAQIPVQPDKLQARLRLGLEPDGKVLAILPGSRASEVAELAPRFLQAASLLQKEDPALRFIVPLVNEARQAQFNVIAQRYPVKNLHCFRNRVADHPIAWDIMEACDAALVASGTATLETALFQRPMVISYVLTPLMRRLMEWKAGQDGPSLPWVGLPNVLLREFAVPELLQEAATPANLASACVRALTDTTYIAQTEEKFRQLHRELNRDTARLAAEAILATAQR